MVFITMKNLILIIVCFLYWTNEINAQTDTIRTVRLRSDKEVVVKDTIAPKNKSNETPASPSNDMLTKEVQELRNEINALKQKKQSETDKKIVIVPSKAKKVNVQPEVSYTSVGMNITTLLSRLVPFGDGIPLGGVTTIMMRRYKDNRAFRMGLGLNASGDAQTLNAALRIGSERKRDLNPKYTFTRGVDFMIASGSFNTPGFNFSTSGVATLGVALTFGLEYNVNKYISIGTEALIFSGIGGNTSSGSSVLNIKILPPAALYIHTKLY
jgi:hypothetical protein